MVAARGPWCRCTAGRTSGSSTASTTRSSRSSTTRRRRESWVVSPTMGTPACLRVQSTLRGLRWNVLMFHLLFSSNKYYITKQQKKQKPFNLLTKGPSWPPVLGSQTARTTSAWVWRDPSAQARLAPSGPGRGSPRRTRPTASTRIISGGDPRVSTSKVGDLEEIQLSGCPILQMRITCGAWQWWVVTIYF